MTKTPSTNKDKSMFIPSYLGDLRYDANAWLSNWSMYIEREVNSYTLKIFELKSTVTFTRPLEYRGLVDLLIIAKAYKNSRERKLPKRFYSYYWRYFK